MREHPIPQDITSYRFHIIGSMTLKQFAEVFLGVIAAIIIYSTNLPQAIKWLLILTSVGLGAGAAFVPIAERPLDHWIITFFKTLYKPTKFFWKRTSEIPAPFKYQPRKNQQKFEPELDLAPAKRERIKEYLTSVNTPSEYQTDLTEWEANRVKQISEIFSTTQPAPTTAQPRKQKQQEKPQMTVRVRSLRSNTMPVNKDNTGNQEVTIYRNTSAQPASPSQQQQQAQPPAEQQQAANQAQQQNQQQTQQQENQPTNVPQDQPTQVQAQAEQNDSTQNQQESGKYTYVENQRAQAKQRQKQTREADFNLELPFPEPPSQPNKIVGMVLTPNNELITNAIVEIQTEDGQIVRAVKTNALGQFFISTSLSNGSYVVETEKEGFEFTPQKIQLAGEPVAPLEIRSV